MDYTRKAFADALATRNVVARFLEAADYQEYVERKRKDGEKPLDRKEWEARVEGKGEGEAKEEKPAASSGDGELYKDAPEDLDKMSKGQVHKVVGQLAKKPISELKKLHKQMDAEIDGLRNERGKLGSEHYHEWHNLQAKQEHIDEAIEHKHLTETKEAKGDTDTTKAKKALRKGMVDSKDHATKAEKLGKRMTKLLMSRRSHSDDIDSQLKGLETNYKDARKKAGEFVEKVEDFIKSNPMHKKKGSIEYELGMMKNTLKRYDDQGLEKGNTMDDLKTPPEEVGSGGPGNYHPQKRLWDRARSLTNGPQGFWNAMSSINKYHLDEDDET